MKKSITKINPKVEKKKKNHSMILVWFQLILTIALVVLGIVTLFNHGLFIWLQLLLGITIIDMGMNNYLIYKRPYVTIFYVIVGLLIIISFILKVIGV